MYLIDNNFQFIYIVNDNYANFVYFEETRMS